MSDAFDTHQARIAEYRKRLMYVEGATGVAVAVGGKIVALDLFDKPSTCRKVWDRLLSGVVFDALETGQADQTAAVADVERLLGSAGTLPWEPAEVVGEGEEYRAESTAGDHASALVFGGAVVHGSVVTAV
jgi:hypothetical protein